MLLHLYLMGKISKKRLLGTARVVAYGLTVSAAFGALTVRNAVADVKSESLELGRNLEGLQDLVHGAQEVRLNGQSVYFAAATTPEPVNSVLDRFEAHCDSSAAFDAVEWKSLMDMAGTKTATPPELRDHVGVMRKDDGVRGDGVVMCFTDRQKKNFLGALRTFGETGDLHSLGNLRYVHASRKGDRTTVQTVWTDGSFNIRTLMSDGQADTMGSDFATLPRPMQSRRLMTAEAVGTPYAARIYASNAAPEVVLNDYQARMEKDGWASIKSDLTLENNNKDGRWFLRPTTGEQAVVSVTKNSDGKTSVVVGTTAIAQTSPKEGS